MSSKHPSLHWRRLAMSAAVAAGLAGGAVTIPSLAQEAAAPQGAAAPATRPALAQLDGELRALYADVAAGTVRVHLPAPAVARLFGPDVDPRGLLRKWGPELDHDVLRLLPREGRPLRFRLEADGDADGNDGNDENERVSATSRPAADGGATIDRRGPRGALEFRRPFDRDRMTMMVMPDQPAGDTLGVVYDDAGHVVVPAYVDREALGGSGTVRVTAGDQQVNATLVGSDEKTNLSVFKLERPVGAPLRLADARPADGSLVLVLPPHRRSVDLAVWTGGHDVAGVVVTVDARVAGVARGGQMLTGGAARPVIDQLIEHGVVRRAQLGAWIFQVPPDDPLRQQVPALGARPAVRVDKVKPDSAAAAAGLRNGDLILSLAGEPVSDVSTFAAAISNRQGPTELKILREGREQTVTVDLQPE